MNSTVLNSILESKVQTLNLLLDGYNNDEILITSSLNQESALLLYFLQESNRHLNVLFINTGLIRGDVNQNIEIFEDTFSHTLEIIDSTKLKSELVGKRDFLSIDKNERSEICKKLKKESLSNVINDRNYKIWLTGIRKSETNERKKMQSISISNDLIKINPFFHLSANEVYFILRSLNLRMFSELEDLCKKNEKNECGLHL
jgi:phosphoadenosine phosphosulfate reductase